jgi:CubicO group peptidase (beta-lactamase class C family)
MRRVTVRHVLSHTTGLPNWRKTPGPLVPTTEPGTQFTYSGEGFFYLQRVVEAVSGRPIARLLEENVLRPLGMTQSSYVWRPEYEQRMAVGYDAQGNREEVFAAMGRRAYIIAREWGKPLLDWRYEDAARTVQLIKQEWPILPVYMVPNVASSLLTTARDYARFLLATTATPPDRALGLSPASLEAMGTLQVRINSALGWGLGWGIQDDEYGRVLWQWGANNSFRNFALVDRINRRAIVVLTNSENGTPVYERVIASLTGHDHPAFLRA